MKLKMSFMVLEIWLFSFGKVLEKFKIMFTLQFTLIRQRSNQNENIYFLL